MNICLFHTFIEISQQEFSQLKAELHCIFSWSVVKCLLKHVHVSLCIQMYIIEHLILLKVVLQYQWMQLTTHFKVLLRKTERSTTVLSSVISPKTDCGQNYHIFMTVLLYQ